MFLLIEIHRVNITDDDEALPEEIERLIKARRAIRRRRAEKDKAQEH